MTSFHNRNTSEIVGGQVSRMIRLISYLRWFKCPDSYDLWSHFIPNFSFLCYHLDGCVFWFFLLSIIYILRRLCLSVYFKRQSMIGLKCIHEENHICYMLLSTTRMTHNGKSACAAGEKMVSISNNPTLKDKIRTHVDKMTAKGVHLFLWVPSYGNMGRKGICRIFDFQNESSAFIKVKCSNAKRSLVYICAIDMMKISAEICKWNWNFVCSYTFFVQFTECEIFV